MEDAHPAHRRGWTRGANRRRVQVTDVLLVLEPERVLDDAIVDEIMNAHRAVGVDHHANESVLHRALLDAHHVPRARCRLRARSALAHRRYRIAAQLVHPAHDVRFGHEVSVRIVAR